MENPKLHKNLIFSQPAWQRFGRSTSGKIGLILTVGLIIVAVLAPLLSPYDAAVDRDYLARLVAPSAKHWFGTDSLGRDLLVRVWHGLGISLIVSLVSVAAGLIVGSLLGLLAGYFRGWVEGAIGILADILLAFPSILLAIAIVTVTGPSLQSVIIAVSAVQIPIYIRLTRSMVLSLREQQFVLAVKALGASDLRIIFRHILPGSLAPLVVQATLSTGTATLEAAGLGFLGLGAQPPAPELGTMLSDAFKGGYALSSPWTILFPGLLITLTVLGLNLLGDGLRDVLDLRRN
ncbi:MAG: ABC transporter permease [Microcoleus sp. PH2017_10_PVI_O_A]|uniref:ABC transporter permease n=1 Tax=unclassified Microcoleus TaxID=2642155 RepID=UPI001DDEA101|nr:MULTISPECIES: ABC transporter permease [unclassified Microcoleus]TAE74397.1 MAG: ABC transporter permease [Oscillatoriales cyanobacterium]MCC3409743.1 ABC transporter permease [Microcoleus sp. PH2017_10_PVI_O_A]MCC3464009.1 ABC transporter permease [Microcoleus sp. PH2017_11_PCY_U_A]MCC3482339.1 ABC transporter permease [Microcoleus sp. PH2017_12_PCY_D_A]MCC3532198.1 ABC transporter permease [Microcoleus sp. PH2017_21_RUC_O_A]